MYVDAFPRSRTTFPSMTGDSAWEQLASATLEVCLADTLSTAVEASLLTTKSNTAEIPARRSIQMVEDLMLTSHCDC